MTIDEILGPILGVEERTLSLEDSPKTIPAWDSVTQVQVILAVEEAIGTDLTAAEALTLTSVRAIIETFRRHGVALEVLPKA